MVSRAVLGALIGFGIFVQILLGESGFAAGSLRDVHAGIGILGVVVVLAYLFSVFRSRFLLVAVSAVVLLTVIQAVLGLSLYGLLPLGMNHQALEISHRANAYLLFAAGIAFSIASAILRRRQAKT